MHEMSIAQSLVSILQEEMTKHGASALRSVRLSVGEMSAIVPESLSFCFEIIIQGTPLEGAKLLMDRIPLKGYCPQCDESFDIKDFVFVCPDLRQYSHPDDRRPGTVHCGDGSGVRKERRQESEPVISDQ